ncbi:ABC transporter permease [Demequina sediminicola]|uniref:ABC transporter permease n=1 Tax=Demequina sediminicola TaxID=1095026 RepID=UPI000B28BCAB|nr:ABC transporter permease [Demequina sediminicola]
MSSTARADNQGSNDTTMPESMSPHSTEDVAGGAATISPHAAGSHAKTWRRFLVRRFKSLAISLVLLVLMTFFIVQLIPGDPAEAIAGPDASPATVDAVRAELGLDDPTLVQLWDYLVGVASGDFGESFRYGVPALDIVMAAAPYTVTIAFASVLIVLVGGVALGISVAIATRGDRRRWLGTAFTTVTSVFTSIPPYILATFLVVIFALWLSWFPPAYTLAYGFWQSAILPIAALSIGSIGGMARIVRREAAVVEEMDYMRSARGWRLPALVRYGKHLLPNVLTTALTLSGIILTALLGSALIVETVFGWPGIGSAVIRAIAEDKDYPVIRAAVFVIGAISLVTTLVIDIILGAIDPRTLGEEQ